MLFVRVAHPRLELDGDKATMSIEDPHAQEDAPRIPLVTATLQRVGGDETTAVWGSDDVALTAEGVALFNDVYSTGEPFEPLVVQLPATTRQG